MKFKRLLSTVMASTMLLSTAVYTAGAENVLMDDAANSWAAEHIERWLSQGIVQGDENGNFNPQNSLTRAQLATIFVNLFGLDETVQNPYGDLGDSWYTDAILKCTAAGIMQGSLDGGVLKANPNQLISRQEVIVMFSRAMGVVPEENPDLTQFSDGSKVADWAAGYVAPLVELGIVSGVGGNQIASTANIDRASTMALLDKAISHYVTEPGTVVADNNKGFVVVNIDGNNNSNVTISGEAAGVVIAAGTESTGVTINNLKADSLKLDSQSDVNIQGSTAVDSMSVNGSSYVALDRNTNTTTVTVNDDDATVTIKGAVGNTIINGSSSVVNEGTITNIEINADATIQNNGTVTNASINSETTIKNNGKIENTNVNADSVVIDGNKPQNTYVDESVTEKPSTSTGTEIKPTVDKPIEMPPVTEPEPEPKPKPDQGGSSSSGGSSSTPVYTVSMNLLGKTVETTDAQSATFGTVFNDLLTKIENDSENTFISVFFKAINDLNTTNPEKINAWSDYYNTFLPKIVDATNELGTADKSAAQGFFDAFDPAKLVNANVNNFKSGLITNLRELFFNTDNSIPQQFTAFLTKLSEGGVNITVNGQPVQKDNIANIAKLIHNAPMNDWYNSSYKDDNGEIEIFFQFGGASPVVEEFGNLASLLITIK